MSEDVLKYLGTVKSLLSEQMPDDEEQLIEHLRLVEAHYSRVGSILAMANGALDLAIGKYYQDVAGQEMSQAEKKVQCDVAVVEERIFRDKVESLSEAIELRITLGQSILKQQRGEKIAGRYAPPSHETWSASQEIQPR